MQAGAQNQGAPPPQQQSGGAAQAVGGFFSSLTQKAQNVAETAKVATSLSKFKILLVIDDAQTDWLVSIEQNFLVCGLNRDNVEMGSPT